MDKATLKRGSEGTVYEPPWVFKAGSRTTSGRFDFMVGDVDYLSGPRLHTHVRQEDTFYVLSGVLTVQVETDIVELEGGDFITVPPGVAHTFDNLNKEQGVVRVLNVMTPGGLDSFLSDLSGLDDASDIDMVDRVAKRHGITFVGGTLADFFGLE